MTKITKNIKDDLRRGARVYLLMLISLSFFILPSQAFAQQRAAKPRPKATAQAKDGSAVNRRSDKGLKPRNRAPDFISKQLEEEVTLLFTLDWTNCQIHRVSDDQPLEIVLNGTIESNSQEIWMLSPVQPKPEITPDLHYIDGVNEGVENVSERKTPLEWSISLDKGLVEPMTILPDNSLTYTFPAGQHCFQVRITGKLERDQPAGYYQLQLAQSFAPQL